MLFDEYKLKNLGLRNRIVMAPMTRCMSPKNIPGLDVAEYYERRAIGEVGLIITEGIEVSHVASSSYPDVPRLDSEKARDAWKLVVSKIKEAGGSVIAQLWHSGAMREVGMGPDPSIPAYTPSGLSSKNNKNAHAVTPMDIKDIAGVFGQDAKWCEEIGFDGVEIHGAHGYLIDNFFWATLNEREDEYGGSISKRSQFAKEITESVRAHVSSNFIVGMRFSQWKQQDFEARLVNSPDELTQLLMPIVNSGLDYLHASNRRYWEKEFKESENNLAYWAQKISGLPTIAVGSVGLESTGESFINFSTHAQPVNIDQAVSDVSERKYDMLAVGRALLADPDWVIKMREGRLNEISPYNDQVLAQLTNTSFK